MEEIIDRIQEILNTLGEASHPLLRQLIAAERDKKYRIFEETLGNYYGNEDYSGLLKIFHYHQEILEEARYYPFVDREPVESVLEKLQVVYIKIQDWKTKLAKQTTRVAKQVPTVTTTVTEEIDPIGLD